MNIKMIPDSGSGFVICKGNKAVTRNNPEGQFVVPIIDVNDNYHAYEVGSKMIKEANGPHSKYHGNEDLLKMRKLAPLPVSPGIGHLKFFPKKKRRAKSSAYPKRKAA